LGEFAVRRGERPILPADWQRPAVRRLFQYFALHRGQRLSRDRILEDLWPGADPTVARASFNQVFSWLRRLLEPAMRPRAGSRYLTVEDDTYCFDPRRDPRVAMVDVAAFEAAVRPVLDASDGHDLPPLPESLLTALAAWKPLLPDDSEFRSLADWAAGQPAQPSATDRRMMGLFHALHYEVVLALLLRWLPPETVEEVVDAASGILLFQYHIDQALALGRPDLLDAAQLREVLAAAWPAAQKRAEFPGWSVPPRFAFVNEYFRGKLPRRMGFDTEVVAPPGGPTVPFQLREVAFAGMKLYFAPAFHMVFDLSRPGGWFHLPGGASERRFGPGYGQGVREWLTGRFLPIGSPTGPAPV